MKNFSTQYRECRKNGTIKEITCINDGQVLLLCKIFLDNCNSGLCKELRLKLNEDEPLINALIKE